MVLLLMLDKVRVTVSCLLPHLSGPSGVRQSEAREVPRVERSRLSCRLEFTWGETEKWCRVEKIPRSVCTLRYCVRNTNCDSYFSSITTSSNDEMLIKNVFSRFILSVSLYSLHN